MQVPIALLGSASDHGGRVITGQSTYLIDDQPAACQGDLHECPIKGHGVTPILEGAANFLIDGRPAAYVGCRTGCGATLIQGAPNFTRWVDAPAVGAGAVRAARESWQSGYDEHFSLVDEATGQPAPEMHYELDVQGQPYVGVSAPDGSTDHAVSDAPGPVALVAAAQQRMGLRP